MFHSESLTIKYSYIAVHQINSIKIRTYRAFGDNVIQLLKIWDILNF